jgi:hypothetical protein
MQMEPFPGKKIGLPGLIPSRLPTVGVIDWQNPNDIPDFDGFLISALKTNTGTSLADEAMATLSVKIRQTLLADLISAHDPYWFPDQQMFVDFIERAISDTPMDNETVNAMFDVMVGLYRLSVAMVLDFLVKYAVIGDFLPDSPTLLARIPDDGILSALAALPYMQLVYGHDAMNAAFYLAYNRHPDDLLEPRLSFLRKLLSMDSGINQFPPNYVSYFVFGTFDGYVIGKPDATGLTTNDLVSLLRILSLNEHRKNVRMGIAFSGLLTNIASAWFLNMSQDTAERVRIMNLLMLLLLPQSVKTILWGSDSNGPYFNEYISKITHKKCDMPGDPPELTSMHELGWRLAQRAPTAMDIPNVHFFNKTAEVVVQKMDEIADAYIRNSGRRQERARGIVQGVWKCVLDRAAAVWYPWSGPYELIREITNRMSLEAAASHLSKGQIVLSTLSTTRVHVDEDDVVEWIRRTETDRINIMKHALSRGWDIRKIIWTSNVLRDPYLIRLFSDLPVSPVSFAIDSDEFVFFTYLMKETPYGNMTDEDVESAMVMFFVTSMFPLFRLVARALRAGIDRINDPKDMPEFSDPEHPSYAAFRATTFEKLKLQTTRFIDALTLLTSRLPVYTDDTMPTAMAEARRVQLRSINDAIMRTREVTEGINVGRAAKGEPPLALPQLHTLPPVVKPLDSRVVDKIVSVFLSGMSKGAARGNELEDFRNFLQHVMPKQKLVADSIRTALSADFMLDNFRFAEASFIFEDEPEEEASETRIVEIERVRGGVTNMLASEILSVSDRVTFPLWARLADAVDFNNLVYYHRAPRSTLQLFIDPAVTLCPGHKHGP